MGINAVGWLLFALFFFGGIALTLTVPQAWVGQIWIVVSVVMLAFFWLLGRKGTPGSMGSRCSS